MALSTWERTTGIKVIDTWSKPKANKPSITAAEFKRRHCNRKAMRQGAAKFEKAAHLSGTDLRKLSDTWDNRLTMNGAELYKPTEAAPCKVTRY